MVRHQNENTQRTNTTYFHPIRLPKIVRLGNPHMCGRTAQTVHAVRMAASRLNVDVTPAMELDEASDNYNLSPGMDAFVFYVNERSGNIELGRKVWGLVPRAGTTKSPLASGMGKHFQNLMFNARADTLYDKPTFSRLIHARRSCIIAVDGFFEWKTGSGGIKQPYFVSSSSNEDSNILLMAGLWTSVATGETKDNGSPEYLDTFTILTTDVCESLKWLHSRMPVNVTNGTWLQNCSSIPCEVPSFRWHAVTPAMSSMKFRSEKAIQALPKVKTVKSMFAAAAAKPKNSAGAGEGSEGTKKKRTLVSTPSPTRKVAKTTSAVKNTPTIDSFFKPKSTAR